MLLSETPYKIFMDESYAVEKDSQAKAEKWRYLELRGPKGIIYPYSAQELIVCYVRKKRISNKSIQQILDSNPGWKIQQNGDWEVGFRVPNEDVYKGAALIQAKRRRNYSPETLAKLRERGKILGRSRRSQPNFNE